MTAMPAPGAAAGPSAPGRSDIRAPCATASRRGRWHAWRARRRGIMRGCVCDRCAPAACACGSARWGGPASRLRGSRAGTRDGIVRPARQAAQTLPVGTRHDPPPGAIGPGPRGNGPDLPGGGFADLLDSQRRPALGRCTGPRRRPADASPDIAGAEETPRSGLGREMAEGRIPCGARQTGPSLSTPRRAQAKTRPGSGEGRRT